MAKRPLRSEAELAQELKELLQNQIKRKRLTSILISGTSVLAAVILGLLGLAMEAFCLFVIALIGLIRYVDASGQLQEVRRRSTKSLVPRISLLQRKDQPASSNPGQSLPQG